MLTIMLAVVSAILPGIQGTDLSAAEDCDRRHVEVVRRIELRPERGESRVEFVAAVPFSRRGQKVDAVHLVPRPATMLERSGNRYARWTFKNPGEVIVVEMFIVATLIDIDLDSATPERHRLRASVRRKALSHERFIEKRAAEIVRIVPRGDRSARGLSACVDATLGALAPLGRWNHLDVGARAAVRCGRGDCSEYAEVLVAVCRGAGIPARFVQGITMSWGDTPFHDWVEAWIPGKGWVRVDPLAVEYGADRLANHRNRYLAFTDVRNDPVLNGGHYYAFKTRSGRLAVEDHIRVREIDSARDAKRLARKRVLESRRPDRRRSRPSRRRR